MRQGVGRTVALAGLLMWGCSGSATNPVAPGPTSPSAAPTPSPTPTPAPVVVAKSCTLPPMPNHNDCQKLAKSGNGVYYSPVVESIKQLRQEKPDFFNGQQIRQVNKYFDGVIRILEQTYGLCAVRGGEGFPSDEIGVKGENSFSEQFDIMAGGSDGNVYTIWDYTATCKPARF